MLVLHIIASVHFDFWCLTLNFQSSIIGKVRCWGKNCLEHCTACNRSVTPPVSVTQMFKAWFQCAGDVELLSMCRADSSKIALSGIDF